MKVFLSYPRADDQYNAGSLLLQHLANELEILVPDSSVFLDSDIHLGSDFKHSLLREIDNADVFIILLAPRWWHSDFCRMEYEHFVAKERRRGLEPRILPILWVSTDTLSLLEKNPIAESLLKLEWFDWSDVRHHEWNSESLRARTAELAVATVRLAQRAPSGI